MNLSNRFLAVLLIAAIVISLAGTFYSINKLNKFAFMTGKGTSGYVNVTIINATELNVTATECNFGSGAVNASYAYAILASNGTITNWNGTGTATNMSIRNDGNMNLNIIVTAGKSKANFLGGGTQTAYKVFAGDKEGGACASIWVSMAYPGADVGFGFSTDICTGLFPNDTADEMWIGCYLEISDNTPPGSKTDTWTFTASPTV